jgi:hypothetical protein
MRVRSVGAGRLPAHVTALLVLLSLAPSLSGAQGIAVPFMMATLVLAVLALVIAAARLRRPLVRAAIAWHHAGSEIRTAARQCDPDAAGHVRPRAPGVALVPHAS